MTYPQTLDYLFSKLPMYQRIGAAAYKADLNNTIAICKALETALNASRPPRPFPSPPHLRRPAIYSAAVYCLQSRGIGKQQIREQKPDFLWLPEVKKVIAK